MSFKPLYELLPDADALLILEPEELAGIVLESIVSQVNAYPEDINRYNFSMSIAHGNYPIEKQMGISQAVMEAWVWLEHEGMIALSPQKTGDWYFVTRRGKRAANNDGILSYRNSALLPKKHLHPLIAQKCWSSFLRGEYDTAVFQAYKLLEVEIRTAGQFSASDIGTDLARKAFRSETGPLTNKILPIGEQESMTHLFAGAIGLYKNPHSHRHVILQADEAVEMISLASHLLKIVDLHIAMRESN